jgi:hypothetical protein
MTCAAQHAFCLKCIFQYVEKNDKLKECPSCRGPTNGNMRFIMIKNQGNYQISLNQIDEYYSSKMFFKSYPVIKKIERLMTNQTPLENSCLTSENEILIFTKNREQLILYHKMTEDLKYPADNAF